VNLLDERDNSGRETVRLASGQFGPAVGETLKAGEFRQRCCSSFGSAKRLECVELAPAFERPLPYDSASKLDALHTLRVAVFLHKVFLHHAVSSTGILDAYLVCPRR
jgi:hypothetical protein